MSSGTLISNLPQKFGAVLADPPWRFATYSGQDGIPKHRDRGRFNGVSSYHYTTMTTDEIAALPVASACADDCVLFLWISWPQLPDALRIIDTWGFKYKTCAFSWMKARAAQIEMFADEMMGQMGLGYWTRSNNESCLLATRGKPKRLNADVRQAIIEPRREHSRKPDCVYGRIERLVAGPYLELFARNRREGWTSWGNEVDKYDAVDDFSRSIEDCYAAVRERKAQGGKGWPE